MSLKITIDDLIIAYRKAKADVYFERGQLSALDFADYEKNLYENLSSLLAYLLKLDFGIETDKIVGSHAFIIKNVEFEENDQYKNVYDSDDKNHSFYSNNQRNLKSKRIINFQVRVIGRHPVIFHIISALWIEKVGFKLESIVGEHSYGCRLKRKNQKPDKFIPNKKAIPDKLELGQFRPYISDYKRWQQNGVNAIEKALDDNKKVIAITADINKFYHRIDPTFLISREFINSINIYLNDQDIELTEILVRLIQRWSEKTIDSPYLPAEFYENGHCGVPVGLSASKVIANILLAFLDDQIIQQLQPIYYGRYVDDIFLVIEDNGKINSSQSLWEFIEIRINSIRIDINNEPNLIIPYSPNSVVEFGRKKEKLFFLEDSSGKTFIETIKEHFAENGSEWRMLPNSEEDTDSLASEITQSSSQTEEFVTGLRKADGVSIQRFKFSIKLRNFEKLVELLPSEVWDEGLEKFFTIVKDYILIPERLSTFVSFYPRLLGLAVSAKK